MENESVSAAEARGRIAGLEEACRAICGYCDAHAKGAEEIGPADGKHHLLKFDGRNGYIQCHASIIRALLSKAASS